MKELLINEKEAGQRLDKYLKKYLNNAPSGFLHKMLRKKNITLNGSKADGSELIHEKDRICLFLADDTINKFRKDIKWDSTGIQEKPDILYEDEDILLVNKPVGVLSQKASPQDVSINEIIIDYLIKNGTISMEELSVTKPSVCNRLDRNTSGIITFGKNLRGTRMLSGGLKERTIEKYYICVADGIISQRSVINGFLQKNEKTNKVFISEKKLSDDAEKIITEYIPVCNNGIYSLLKIKLHTGKTHQIRAHLASMGHPLIGDYKYGSLGQNDAVKKRYHIQSQLLHAFEIYIPAKDLRVFAPFPASMEQFLEGEHLWEPGNQEDLEALH